MPAPERSESGELAAAEYVALRATIRERGTARVWITALTFFVWAALAIILAATSVVPAFSLLSLLVLVAGFEVILALHVGVERIGRYLQVFHEGEDSGRAQWEKTAMAYRQAYPGAGPDPLCIGLFLLATGLNFLPVALVGAAPELAGLGAVHLLFPVRLVMARQSAARQRAEDLQRFRSLRGDR